MNNMFKNAYFGKLYRTEDGRKAAFVNWNDRMTKAFLYVKERDMEFYGEEMYDIDGITSKGSTPHNIVSEWVEPIICKCQWKDYYDYRIMLPNGEGHVRVSFFTDEIIISDLYVSEEHRHKYYATTLLDKVDELLAGKKAVIYPLEEWQEKWYEQRGYIIGKEDSIDEKELDELANAHCEIVDAYDAIAKAKCKRDYKAGYRKAKQR